MYLNTDHCEVRAGTVWLAFDRSMRRKDADGHLHVEMTNITKCNVCPYYGREIPNGKALGLDPNRVYKLYRDPAELKAAAPTFAGKPLLFHHIPVTADEPATELVVGAIGTDVEYIHPYLRAPLSVWRADAIEAIDSGEQRELSAGYRYRADMTPGVTPDGLTYDGVMRDIKANHVAIVSEGRAGPDVVVADALPTEFSAMKFPRIMAALAAVIPTMKASEALALDAALALDVAGKPDADGDYDGMSEDSKKAALDAYCAKTGKAMDALTDGDKNEAFKAAKDSNPVPGSGKDKPAMDEAIVSARVAEAVAAATKDMVPKADADKLAQDAATAASASVHALYTARTAVESTVGVCALDSAEAVYRFALDHLKVDHKDTPAPALAALYTASAQAATAPAIATDAAPSGKFDPKILGLSHIRKG